MLDLLQKHTVDLYGLNLKRYVREDLPAQELLVPTRFDLFAKLFYIKNRETQPLLARRVYKEHILAFNPDGKEPGRTDKNGTADFIRAFDQLIDHFKTHDFDSSVSLIPVSENGVPLDGSHRIAALAYFGKKVAVMRFEGVHPVCNFDYHYFLKRGLPLATADLITKEAVNFSDQLYVACLWPKLGKPENRDWALARFQKEFGILYIKSLKVSLNGLGLFMYEIYKHQDWVGNVANNFKGARSKALSCFARNGMVQFIVFPATALEKVVEVKEQIREHYHLEKHALHITDNPKETAEILALILTEKAKDFTNAGARISNRLQEWQQRCRDIYWLNFKIKTAAALKKLMLYKK